MQRSVVDVTPLTYPWREPLPSIRALPVRPTDVCKTLFYIEIVGRKWSDYWNDRGKHYYKQKFNKRFYDCGSVAIFHNTADFF